MSTTYFAPAGISLRALLLDNEDRSYEFRHEPIGVRRRPRPAPRPGSTVAAVRFSGTLGFAESELRGQLRLTEGDRFDFAAWQQDSDRLRRYYQAHGYFESRVRARRTLADSEPVDPTSNATVQGTVTLEYAIEQGRPTRLEVSGYQLPDEVQRRIVERWASAIFDRFLERDVDRIAREYLFGEGRPAAKVTATLAEADGARTLHVEIDPGPVAAARLQIEGNESVPTARVLEVAGIGGPAAAWLDPALVEAAVKRLYQAAGLLSADVDVSAPDLQDGESVVRVVIQEGGPWQVGRVTLGGVEQLSTPADLGLVPGTQYDPRAISEGLARLEQQFRNDGFLDVRVASETVLDPATRRADVHALVAPGPRTVLASVAVDGADGDDAKIAQALGVSPGMPVGASALGAARRRLYETGIYRSVEIELEPVPDSRSVRLQPDEFEQRNRRTAGRGADPCRGTPAVQPPLRPCRQQRAQRSGGTRHARRVRRRLREPEPARARPDRRSLSPAAARSRGGARVSQRESILRPAAPLDRLPLALPGRYRFGPSRAGGLGRDRNQRGTDVPGSRLSRSALRLRPGSEPHDPPGIRSDGQDRAADDERPRRPPQRSVRPGTRLVQLGKHRAVQARARLGSQFLEKLPAALSVRPASRRSRARVGSAGGTGANLQG